MSKQQQQEWISVRSPEVGDLADHITREVDPRTVAHVHHGRRTEVCLWVSLEHVIGPFDAKLYTYKRKVQ